MNIVDAVVLGLVEGITEYLPVSSTGHLIIASHLLGLERDPAQKAATDAFNIVIQGGAILAVAGLYWPRFLGMVKGLLGLDPAGLRLLVNLVIAFLPAAVVGLLIHKWIKANLFAAGPVVAAMILGGVYMLLVDQWRSGRFGLRGFASAGKGVDDMSPGDALKIGLLQVLSMWPGTSRSMMTITGGYFVGLRPAAAAEFSFLLGMPTLLAATLKELYGSYRDSRLPVGHPEHAPMFYEVLGAGPVLVGLLVAAVSAAVAVKWLVGFLTRHGLSPFGWYRIVVGIALAGLIVGGVVSITPEAPAPETVVTSAAP
jgi:undecaprenyl-diphosphatase